jgi:hypothetical protein
VLDIQANYLRGVHGKMRKDTSDSIGVSKHILIMKKPIQLANSQQGWVKLQRSTLDTPMMKNPILLQIYVWCLLKANHQPKWFSIKVGKGCKEVHCDVGQFITGRNRATDDLGIPGSTWYTNITKLKDYSYLEIESNSHYSLITVVNYGGAAPDAQPLEQPKKILKNNSRAAKEQQKNTNNNNEKEKKVNNISEYSFLANSKNLNSINENLRKEYLLIAKLIDEKLDLLLSNFKPLNPKHYKLLRRSFSNKEIESTLISLNSDPIKTDRKSLYLHVKDTLKSRGVATSNETKREKDYVSIAYGDVKNIIAKELPGVAAIPQQISFKPFSSLFNKYDFEDIVRKLEDLEQWESVSKQKSLSKILQTFLDRDKNVHPLEEGMANSFIKEQKRLERKKHYDLEKQKKEEEFQNYFIKVKDLKVWAKLKIVPSMKDREQLVKDYFSFLNNFNRVEYPNFSHLDTFTLKQAIKYEDKHLSLEWLGSQLEEFHKSSTVKNYTSANKFLLDHTIALYPEGWEDEED